MGGTVYSERGNKAILCVIAKIDAASRMRLAGIQRIAEDFGIPVRELYGHITLATYLGEEEEAFVASCKASLPCRKAFPVRYDQIEVLDATSIMQSYDSAPVDLTATPRDYAYGRSDVTVLGQDKAPADLLTSLKLIYSGKTSSGSGYPSFPSAVVSIPVDKRKVVERGLVAPRDTADIVDNIVVDLSATNSYRSKGYISLGELLMLDIVATNAANGWPRPIYWVTTVGSDYHLGMPIP